MRIFHVISILTCLQLGGYSLFAQNTQTEKELLSTAEYSFQLANRHIDNLEWPEAAALLRTTIEKAPQMEPAYFNLALSYYQMQGYLQAELTLERLFRVNPLHEKAQGLYGLVLFERGQYSTAIHAFNFAIDQQASVELRLSRAFSFIAAGRPKYALPDFDEVLHDNPGNVKACIGKGAALMELGKHKYALRFFNRILEIDPENAEAYTNRAICFHFLEDRQRSDKDFQLACSFDQNARILLARAKCNIRAQKFRSALSDVKSALRYEAQNPEVYSVLGEIELENENFKAAKESFSIAIDLDHNNVQNYLLISEAEALACNYNNAIKNLYKALDLMPECEQAREMLLWVFAKMDSER